MRTSVAVRRRVGELYEGFGTAGRARRRGGFCCGAVAARRAGGLGAWLVSDVASRRPGWLRETVRVTIRPVGVRSRVRLR